MDNKYKEVYKRKTEITANKWNWGGNLKSATIDSACILEYLKKEKELLKSSNIVSFD